MSEVLFTIALSLCLGQDSPSEIEDNKAKLLGHLNLDPSSHRDLYPGEYFLPTRVSDAVVDSVGQNLKTLTFTNGYPALAFASRFIESENPERPTVPGLNSYPVILIHDGTNWHTIIETPFAGSGWRYAARSTEGSRVYAITDNHVEAPGGDLPILASEDGGWTWEHVAYVNKPSYLSSLHDFTVDSDGQGTLTVVLGDVESFVGTHMSAYFTTLTTDWGRSWSPYEVRWNAMREGGVIVPTWRPPQAPSVRTQLEKSEEFYLEDLDRIARHSSKFDRGDLPIPPPQSYLEKLTRSIAEGFEVNTRFADGQTLLHRAIRSGSGNAELVKFLLKSGASPTSPYENWSEEYTPLELAERHGNEAIIELLIDAE